jgi:hypothetical protein
MSGLWRGVLVALVIAIPVWVGVALLVWVLR